MLIAATLAPSVVHAQASDGYGSSFLGPVPLRQSPSSLSNSSSNRDSESNRETEQDRDSRLDRREYQARDCERTPFQQSSRNEANSRNRGAMHQGRIAPCEPPSEFEAYVQRLAGPNADIRRFGADLVVPPQGKNTPDASPLVPPDYLVKPGDELQLSIWGSAEADLRLLVDRSGRITIPRVGPVLVAGVRYADLPKAISQRVGQVFRNFDLSVSLAQVRGMRVFVTGFVPRPGSYSVNSLSTVVHALAAAGGPSSAGSFRDIQVKRGGKRVAAFDLYDLLLKGDRSGDQMLQPDDVIYVGPVGPQVGLIGSVNKPAIFELRGSESISDLIAMAGGVNAVGDRQHVALERFDERRDVKVIQLTLPKDGRTPLSQGDVVRVTSIVELAMPIGRQNKRVRVEGEVARPGDYVLPAESTIADAIKAAGGTTSRAYLFGTEFNRESVRQAQEENYERTLRDLESEITKLNSTPKNQVAEDVAMFNARQTTTNRLLDRLRRIRPNGRVVLQMASDSPSLPELALEDGDRLLVPPRPTSVAVFGSVFNAGNYLFAPDRDIEDFLRLAGGPTRGADAGSIFVIRPNGSVVSARQHGSWFGLGGLASLRAEPGDTVFVPEDLTKSSFIQSAKDWAQIFSQFGLGLAAIKTLGN